MYLTWLLNCWSCNFIILSALSFSFLWIILDSWSARIPTLSVYQFNLYCLIKVHLVLPKNAKFSMEPFWRSLKLSGDRPEYCLKVVFKNVLRNQAPVCQASFYVAGFWSSPFSGENSQVWLGKAGELVPCIFPGLSLSVLKIPYKSMPEILIQPFCCLAFRNQ